MARPRPYFTYEAGIDEPAHPDLEVASRLEEFAMSDCKYGCKIYKDPLSNVQVLKHSAVYGCNKKAATLIERS